MADRHLLFQVIHCINGSPFCWKNKEESKKSMRLNANLKTNCQINKKANHKLL